MSTVTNQPVGCYLPAATDVGNSFVQSSVTYIGAPASYIGNIHVTHSTATTPSQVFVSTDLVSSYPWSQYFQYGVDIAYYANPPLSG